MLTSYAALAAEIAHDPMGLGFAALVTAGSDQRIADVLNAPCLGVETLWRSAVPVSEILNCLTFEDLNALDARQVALLRLLLSVPVDATKETRRNHVLSFFPAETAPTANKALVEVMSHVPSRAEHLFGLGTIITADDVARSRGRAQ